MNQPNVQKKDAKPTSVKEVVTTPAVVAPPAVTTPVVVTAPAKV